MSVRAKPDYVAEGHAASAAEEISRLRDALTAFQRGICRSECPGRIEHGPMCRRITEALYPTSGSHPEVVGKGHADSQKVPAQGSQASAQGGHVSRPAHQTPVRVLEAIAATEPKRSRSVNRTFTPGPWEENGEMVWQVHPEGRIIVEAYDTPAYDPNPADLRLIAAAPDLLRVLKQILGPLEFQEEHVRGALSFAKEVAAAKGAIARAEGS